MDDDLCRQFFLQPQATRHRRYEALRAFFIEGQPLAAIAERFGYRLSSLKSLVCRFRASCVHGNPAPFFFPTGVDALPANVAAKTVTGPNAPLPRTSDS